MNWRRGDADACIQGLQDRGEGVQQEGGLHPCPQEEVLWEGLLFYLSREAALKGLGDWDVLNFNRMYGERVIETGRVWVLGSTALEALASLEVHDRLTGQEGVHRDLVDVQEESYRGAMYHGFRVAGTDIAVARARIAARKAWLRDVEVVSLDPV